MKVRCLNLLGATGQPADQSRWLKIGHEYDVLTLSVDSKGKKYVRIQPEDGSGPGLFLLEQFEIADASIPCSWTIQINKKGGLTLGPKEWAEPGFWERYFDGDTQAATIFETERRKILVKE